MRFWIGCKEHTLWETGDVLNIGPERVRQIEAKAFRKLRQLGSADGALKDLRVEEFGAASLKERDFWEEFDAKVQAHHDQNVSQEGGE